MIIMLILATLLTGTQSATLHEFSATTIDGKQFRFDQLKGKKILIVNTASECGYTPQYKDLEELYKKHKDKLMVIGFPANNFGGQEPGTEKEIATFCEKNYGVTFLMMSKVSVKGSDIHPLFKWMIEQENPDFTGNINWNFEKFLFNEEGRLIHRFRTKVSPMDPAVIKAIEAK